VRQAVVSQVNPLLVLQARAEARALLYATGEFDIEQALAPLLRCAISDGIIDQIGAEATFAILRQAFKGSAEL
jgi:hypothetical protein